MSREIDVYEVWAHEACGHFFPAEHDDEPGWVPVCRACGEHPRPALTKLTLIAAERVPELADASRVVLRHAALQHAARSLVATYMAGDDLRDAVAALETLTGGQQS